MKDMAKNPMENVETIEDTISYKFLNTEFKNEKGETKGDMAESLDDYYSRIIKKYDLKKESSEIYKGDTIPIFCYGSNGVE